jgi:hypothetical protein
VAKPEHRAQLASTERNVYALLYEVFRAECITKSRSQDGGGFNPN